MEMLKQYRVAVVGCPDSGKSTFIASLVKAVTGRDLKPDTLMKEVHWSDGRDPMGNPDTRTIKCAKIMFKYGNLEYCMYDCPGHLEYLGQISQGIDGADVVVAVHDCMNADGSKAYFSNEPIRSLLRSGKWNIDVYSHAGGQDKHAMAYDTSVEGCDEVMHHIMDSIAEVCISTCEPHDVLKEAVCLTRACLDEGGAHGVMLYSGGKDSVAGLYILQKAGLLRYVDVMFPSSGYDFDETYKFNDTVSKFFGVPIESFDNSCGKSYETHTAYEMMQAKAEANEALVEDLEPDVLCIQFRASDEGVRSKDYHIVEREYGEGVDLGDNLPLIYRKYSRFSPVFYFSESNIWRMTAMAGLPVNPLYFKGYRSLGDAPVTKPCMPEMNSIGEIIEYIESHPETTERDGRTEQDKSEEFAMEKLRDIGFF